MNAPFTLPTQPFLRQPIERYTPEDQQTWRQLFERQSAVLKDRAVPEFLDGLSDLGVVAGGIPDFERLSEKLMRVTGWRLIAVEGLLPDKEFFAHLAARRFPVTWWIRKPEQIDYLQEPDLFHDLFGHVPLLLNPVFADYMQAYGAGGLKADGLGALGFLARLYWYTVEFGLIETQKGLRIYGAGIVSSKTESIYCLESQKPQRLRFDLMRLLRTRYRIDDLQECYFVIQSFDELFLATAPDFTPLYRVLEGLSPIAPGEKLAGDRPYPA